MILTFAELGINVTDYNGMHVTQAVPAIINHAANMITLSNYAHPATNVETLYDWPATLVDFINHTIEVIPAAYGGWMQINS